MRVEGGKVVDDFELCVDVWRSVIPQDPTLSKFKITASIERMAVDYNMTATRAIRGVLNVLKKGYMGERRRSDAPAIPKMFSVPALASVGGGGKGGLGDESKGRERALHEVNLDEHVQSVFEERGQQGSVKVNINVRGS